jgi:hypothetical protein
MKLRPTILIATAAAVLVAGSLSGIAAAAGGSGKTLTGTLELAAGKLVRQHGRTVYTGTYFRMLLPGKTDEYFSNPQSRAADKTYTLMRPGTDGGLELGHYQPAPSPAFTASGFARANRITQPETFASIKYSISTAAVDAQSGTHDAIPSLVHHGDKLTGNFSAWTAEWNKIYFNQGSPKPNASNPYPGLTQPVTGTYDAKTGAFTITWYSAIVGGPFNGFTGFWHLEGKLKR